MYIAYVYILQFNGLIILSLHISNFNAIIVTQHEITVLMCIQNLLDYNF